MERAAFTETSEYVVARVNGHVQKNKGMNTPDVPMNHLESNVQQEARLGGQEKPLHG